MPYLSTRSASTCTAAMGIGINATMFRVDDARHHRVRCALDKPVGDRLTAGGGTRHLRDRDRHLERARDGNARVGSAAVPGPASGSSQAPREFVKAYVELTQRRHEHFGNDARAMGTWTVAVKRGQLYLHGEATPRVLAQSSATELLAAENAVLADHAH